MKFSVIISVRNEAFNLGATLKRLRQVSTQGPLEIIVVDGGSDDDTAAQARAWADQVVVQAPSCRAERLHLGAQKATGDLFLFLRGDAQLPGCWQQRLERFWLSPRTGEVAATAFSVEFGAGLASRAASFLSNMSVRWRGKALLAHGLCTTAEIYRHSGGFPPLPVLEEIAFCERLRPWGRVVLLPERIQVSAGPLLRHGLVRCVARQAWREMHL